MKAQELILESTTLWDFPTQNYGNKPHGNNKYNGVTPAFIIWNLLQRYTKENDLVVDPMCGSGTTYDVATELNRKTECFDLNIVRDEIKKADARKLPLKDDVADLVFIDSPYSDNIKYSDDKNCIGKISCEKDEFFDELEKVAIEIKRILKEGKVVAWLIGDQWIKRKFTPTGFLLYNRLVKHFETIDIVSVTRHNQTSNTGIWHYRARKYNFYLRGFKYLFIMRKSTKA
ncbi:MAG: DNA methyltransferase [Candidatus Cloacimonadota bacterium]|nr:DNA methyltransferase [Candidatus Cloacimonadota bacterium]